MNAEELKKRIANLPAAKQQLLLRKLEQKEGGREVITASPLHASGGPFPLSLAQERLWFLEQLSSGTAAFNIPTVLRLTGRLRRSVLHRSLREIVRRHASLRTVFPAAEGRAVQKVEPAGELPLPSVDLRLLPREARRAASERLVAWAAGGGFDLERGPLLRILLVWLEDEEHQLIVVMHHIISDGWSFGVMHRELALLYDAFAGGATMSPLPPPALQYVDFADWQRRFLSGEVLARQLAYWGRQLAGVPAIELPTDHPRPAVQGFAGRAHWARFDGPLTTRLEALAERSGASLFMVLLAGFMALLRRVTGQQDFAVGTFVANRNRAELEALIGFFVNNLALRTPTGQGGRSRSEPGPGFRSWLEDVRRTTLDGYAHQDVPFEKILEELNPERDMSRPSLFQVMLVLQNTPQSSQGLRGLTLREETFEGQRSNFEFTLWCWQEGGGLRLRFEYNVDLFEHTTVLRLAHHLRSLFEAALAEPERALGSLPLLRRAERHQLFEEWGKVEAPFAWRGGFPALFETQARRHPDRVAVVAAGQVASWGALEVWSGGLAHELKGRGQGAEAVVAVRIAPTIERMIAVLAVLRAGAVLLALDPDYSSDRLVFMEQDAQAREQLTAARVVEGLVGGTPRAAFRAAVVAEQLAYIVYTSGSTGKPKGVMVSHGALENACLAWEERYGLDGTACHLQMASFSFDVFMGDLVRALGSGGRLVLCPKELLLEPEQLYGWMVRQRVDTAEFVPAVARTLVEYLRSRVPRQDLGLMRRMVVGSDLWYGRELNEVVELLAPGARMINSYGVSEATIDSTYFEPAGALEGERPVPIGRPFPNAKVVVLDRRFEPAPAGAVGELVLGGAGIARGYHRRPALSAERFVPDPWSTVAGGRLYRSGDLARTTWDGQVEFLGRADHQVKVRGFRIEPGEVEAALLEHEGVARAVVVAHPPGAAEKRLVAYLVAEAGPAGELSSTHLREFLAPRLPEYMVPSAFLTLAALPLTPNGKVDRRALPAPDWSRPELRGGFEPPRTPEEVRMAHLWGEVLRVERVGRRDSFFDLGGHSLVATQLMSRVRRVFGVELPLRDLFEAPTVGSLVRRLEAARRQATGPVRPLLMARPGDGDAVEGRGPGVVLSFAQQRLWFLDRLQPGAATYNIPFAVRVEGGLDPALLRSSLERVVERHGSLRTTFVELDGEPRQLVASHGAPGLLRVDLRALGAAGHQEVLALARREARRGFDLATGPLLRVVLVELPGGAQACLLTLHHIIADAWSMGIFFAEMVSFYTALAEGAPARLPALRIQYTDFAVWQRQWLREGSEILRSELEFWRQCLAGVPEMLDLPTDRPRPPRQSYRGARTRVLLPASLVGPLKALSEASGATLFMALLAVFRVLLARFAGQKEVLIGTPIANRNREEVEGLIGFFVNTLVLRTDLAGNPDFTRLLEREREVCLAAYAHQDLPFERLVEEVQPERDLSVSPLFQVMLVFQNVPAPASAGSGLQLEPLELDSGMARFDLMLELNEAAGELVGALEYRTDLFDGTTARRLVRSFGTLLRAAVETPQRAVQALSLLPAAERSQVLVEWNDTRSSVGDGVVSLVQLFGQRMEQTPERVAVVDEARQVSYRELDRRAAALARRLRLLGVGPEVPVALCLERSLEAILGILAVLRAGGAWLPLDPTWPAQRLGFMLADMEVPVVLTRQNFVHSVPTLGEGPWKVLTLEHAGDLCAQPGEELPAVRLGEHSLAHIIYTSGSTGQPKAVGCGHRGVINLLMDFEHRTWAAGVAEEVCSWWTTPTFDATIYEVFPTLLAAGTVEVVPARVHAEGEAFVGWLRTRRVGAAYVPPMMLRDLAKDSHGSALRRLLVGVEPIPESLLDALGEDIPGLFIMNGYGPTEVTVCASLYPLGGHAVAGQIAPIGRPLWNFRIVLVDRFLEPVPMGARGELCIAGPGLARGYLGQPALTAARFVPDPFAEDQGERLYRSGDVVRQRPDGNLEFVGRVDHQVKVRGYRIELGEIEARLGEHPEVREAVVVVRKEQGGVGLLVAWVIPTAAAAPPPTSAALRSFLASRLPEYMVPAMFLPLAERPLTPTGKLDRAHLVERPLPTRVVDAEVSAPRNPGEEILVGIWAEVLGRQEVGIHDDFFDLGGHSLLATRIVSRVRQVFAVELPLYQLFEAPSIAELAQVIAALGRGGPDPRGPVPLPRDRPLPLSFAQQRLWILERLDPGSAVYNIPLPVRLVGPLEVPALAAALAALVRRHEVLRTRFALHRGEPVQLPDGQPPRVLPLVDLRSLPEALRGPESLRLAEVEAARGFDLEHGPLLRARLLRLAETEHVFLLTLHHVVTDGWSMPILIRELATLYGAAVRGEPSPLRPLAVHYADFALWQREWLSGEVLAGQLEVWRRRLEGLPMLELATDRPRPPVPSQRGAHLLRPLDGNLAVALRAFGRRQGATLFMVLLTVFAALLQRLTGQQDFPLGTPIANRNRAEIEELIGFFVNSLVLRVAGSGNLGFQALLERVRRLALEAYAHQDLPFELLVEELEPERDLSRSPLFQVMFALGSGVAPPQRLAAGLTLEPIPLAVRTAKFDLSLTAHEVGEGLTLSAEYSTDLFDATTVARLLGSFERLAAALVAAPGEPIARLDLLAPAERQQLLREWNDRASPWPRSAIHRLFEEHAARTPAAPALVFGKEVLSYGELNTRANRLAHHLGSLGVGPEVPVVLCLERSFEMVVATLAVLKAGGIYVPLDPDYPAERLAFLVQASRASVILTTAALDPRLPAVDARRLHLEATNLENACGENFDVGIGPAHLAYIMYTSGSTGHPKGVGVTHGGVVRLVREIHHAHFGLGEVFLQIAPTSFDAATCEIWGALLNGGTLVVCPPGRLSTAELAQVIADRQVSLLLLTAGLFHQMVDDHLGALSQVRQLLAGGDVLSPAHVRRVLAELPDCRMVNCYGPTENSVFTTCYGMDAGQVLPAAVPIGRPIANTSVWVVDADLRPLPLGVPGELVTGGVGLARGYLGPAGGGARAQTAERFVPDGLSHQPGARLYRTGDSARWLADGTLEFFGRLDHQVKVRGFRIELGEIEVQLGRHPAVQKTVVLARPGAEGDKELVAYVVARSGAEASGVELRAYLEERLPEPMVPAFFLVLEALPLTANDKVDRAALAQLALPERDARLGAHYLAPRTALEEVLAGMWAELLEVEAVGVYDNFFALGGHSLKATRLLSWVEDAFEIQIPLRRVFEEPTVAALAADLLADPLERQRVEATAELLLDMAELSDEELAAEMDEGSA